MADLENGSKTPKISSDVGEIEKQRSDSIRFQDLDAEKVLSAFGKFGRYQMIAYTLVNSVAILYSSQMMIMGFITKSPQFFCDIPTTEQASELDYTVIDNCYLTDLNNRSVTCLDIPHSSYKFNETSPRTTLNSEFDLVCQDEHWAQHGSSLFLFGGMVVTPFLTQLSDLYGRRYSFLIPLWVAVAAAFACSVAPTYGLFLFFRFVAGIGTTGYATIGWVLNCESVPIEFRSMIPIVGTFTWVSGIMMVGVLRMFIDSWRWLYFAISLPGLFTIAYFWLLPESLHWMIAHNRKKGIARYIQASSRCNHMTVCLTECKSNNIKTQEEKTRTFFDMVKNKAIVFHLISHSLIITIMNITYWGLALISTKLSDDSYTGYFLSGLVEIPAGLIAIPLLMKFGRRTITFWCLALQGVSMGFSIIYPGTGKIEMLFPIAAKLFNSILWSSEALLIAEMSPTCIRNIFYGVVNFVGEIGSTLAPYLELLKAIDERAPQAVVAALSAGGALLVLTSPETKDKPMPEDLDQFDVGCLLSRFKCCTQHTTTKQPMENANHEVHPMSAIAHEDTKTTLLDHESDSKSEKKDIIEGIK